MNKFNFYATLGTASFAVGYIIPKIFHGPIAFLVAIGLGLFLGLLWAILFKEEPKKGE